jgi:hypothetical protein
VFARHAHLNKIRPVTRQIMAISCGPMANIVLIGNLTYR